MIAVLSGEQRGHVSVPSSSPLPSPRFAGEHAAIQIAMNAITLVMRAHYVTFLDDDQCAIRAHVRLRKMCSARECTNYLGGSGNQMIRSARSVSITPSIAAA